MPKKNKTITAIEIGTSAVKLIMGQPGDGGTMNILGHEELPTGNKVVKGEIVNVPAVTDLLVDGLNRLESSTGQEVRAAYAAVTGGHIATRNVRASVPILAPDRVIREEDIVEATRQARNYRLPAEQTCVHSFQRTYLIDGRQRSGDPAGKSGNQLTADVHLIHGNANRVETLCNVIDETVGHPASDIAFAPIADFYGIAKVEEQRQGLLIIDIGAGVTEYALFFEQGCMHSGQITVGCDHIANDLAIGLRLPINRCRELIRRQIAAVRSAEALTNEIQVETSIGHEPRRFREATMQTIVELRLRELLGVIRDELQGHDVLKVIGAGIVVCGGGALIPKITELVEDVFSMPASVGYPALISGVVEDLDSPRYVTPVGLLHLASKMKLMDDSINPPLKEIVKKDIVTILDLFKRAIRF